MERLYTIEELKQYWTGLMEGEGSIQVNHWRKKNIQYRMVIKLKYTLANEQMLKKLETAVKGTVRISITELGKWVVWVENDRKKILELMKIFEKYPPLTTKTELQLKFMRECMEHNSIKTYLLTRNAKYALASGLRATRLVEVEAGIYEKPKHWILWLSGFTEAEGCWTYRMKEGLGGYAISQNGDRYLIELIRRYFKIQAKVREASLDHWVVETQARGTVEGIVKWFVEEAPLLGEKGVQMEGMLAKVTAKAAAKKGVVNVGSFNN